MRIPTLVVAAAALAITACGDRGANTAGENGLEPDEEGLLDPSEADPATANLTMESNASAVDQAVNQTDQQSGLDNVVENTATGVGNTVE